VRASWSTQKPPDRSVSPLILAALLYLAAVGLCLSEAKQDADSWPVSGSVQEAGTRPQESFPGQATWDGTEWHLEGE
jgi:hypothetical protein